MVQNPFMTVRRGVVALLCAVLFVAILGSLNHPFSLIQIKDSILNAHDDTSSVADGLVVLNSTTSMVYTRIGKASMAYGYGVQQPLYDRAVDTHARHAARHGYTMHTLGREVASGYWSKTFYLMSLLVSELAKPAEERLEWLMWSDADSIIINQEIPLHVFLPPTSDSLLEDIHFVFARDDWGMNSGVFFIRVHMKSVHVFAKAFAYHICHPDKDLGHAYDQVALEVTLREQELYQHVMWVPRTWFNAMHNEILPGSVCAHFYADGEREKHIGEMLDKLEDNKDPTWQVPYEESFYALEVKDFWNKIQECRQLIRVAEDFVIEDSEKENLEKKLERLRTYCFVYQDNTAELDVTIKEIKQVMYPSDQ